MNLCRGRRPGFFFFTQKNENIFYKSIGDGGIFLYTIFGEDWHALVSGTVNALFAEPEQAGSRREAARPEFIRNNSPAGRRHF